MIYNVNKKGLKILSFLFFAIVCFYIFNSTTRTTRNNNNIVAKQQDAAIIEQQVTLEQGKMAFATFLCDDVMGEATEVLVYSLVKTNTTHDILVLVLDEVSETTRNQLEYLGAKIINVNQVDYPWDSDAARRKGFNKACRYSKLNLWNLTQYKKVVYLDADTMVVQPIDELFEYPQFTAAVDIGGVLNTGVFVAEPNKETYKDMMATYADAPSYNKGDQGFLNYYFNQSANPLPGNYNLMIKFTHFSALAVGFVAKNTAKVLHYTSETKPWNFHFLHQREWRENYDGFLFGLWTRTKREMLAKLEQGGLYTPNTRWRNYGRVSYVCDKSISRGYGRKYPKTEQFSVLLQLTQDVIDTKYLESILKLYASSNKVDQIILNKRTIKDEHGQRLRLNAAYFNKLRIRKPIKVATLKSFRSVNNRFNPIKHVQTNAVYIVDANVVSSVEDIEFGYNVWKKNTDSIVGFQSEKDDIEDSYSMIGSSSGMFLKTDYLYGYTCLMPDDVHYYIDRHPQCRDVAMNMMVSGMTASSPILVKTKDYLYEIGDKQQQQITRNTVEECAQGLAKYFDEQNTLISNDEIISRSTHDIQQSATTLSWNHWDESFNHIY